jgi:formyl-CoA transferase/CoA:oxalate CoA-transferase
VRKTAAQWTEVLDGAGVPCGPILTIAQVFSDPHVLHREMLQEVDHPTAGRIKQTGLPVKLSQTPGRIRSAPPTLGQHTDAILRDLGFDAAAIASLRKERVV